MSQDGSSKKKEADAGAPADVPDTVDLNSVPEIAVPVPVPVPAAVAAPPPAAAAADAETPAAAPSPSKVKKMKKIKKQVEFYFSEFNLPKDNFLQGAMAEEVSLNTILGFNRMKQLGASPELCVASLGNSDTVCLTPKASRIGRKNPLPEVVDLHPRTAYVKGFPRDLSIDALEDFFEQECGDDFGAIRMRRWKGSFKGSVLVNFRSLEGMQRFLAKKEGMAYLGRPLECSTEQEWMDGQEEERARRKREREEGDLTVAKERYAGCYFRVSGFPPEDGEVSFRAVKDLFSGLYDAPQKVYVELPSAVYGEGNAVVRAPNKEVAAIIAQKAGSDEGILWKETKLTVVPVVGDDETTHLKSYLAAMALRGPPRKRQKRY